MDQGKDIIEITKVAVKYLERLDDIVDRALAPIKDYTETAENLAAPIRSVATIYSLAKRLRLKAFLKSYASRINAGINVEKELSRLQSFLSNTKNFELISDTIDLALNAKTVKCCSILGYFAGDILSNTKDVEYKDFIVINALGNLLDDDLSNFTKLYEFLPAEKRYDDYRTHDMKNEIGSLGPETFQLELTIEKLKNSQVIGFNIGGMGHTGNAWGAFKFNENTDYFYEIIKKCGL